MLPDDHFTALVEAICANDRRYRPGAYEFMNEAVAYTVEKLHRNQLSRSERHVSAEELIHGVAEYASEQFGVLAWEVLSDWGLTSGPAVGDVVYNMFEKGLLRAGKEDSREDFNRIGTLKKLLDSSSGRKDRQPPDIPKVPFIA